MKDNANYIYIMVCYIWEIFMKKQQTSGRAPTPTSIIGKPIEDSPPKIANIFKSESLN